MPKKQLLERILKDEDLNIPEQELDRSGLKSQSEEPSKNLSIQQQLKAELNKSSVGLSAEFSAVNLETILKRETRAFESSGSRGKYLSLAYNSYLCI